MLALPFVPFGSSQPTDQALYELLYGSVLVLLGVKTEVGEGQKAVFDQT